MRVGRPLRQLLDRVLPALLLALSVMLLAAGAFSFAPPADIDPDQPPDAAVAGDPLLPTPDVSIDATPSAQPTTQPTTSPTPDPTASPQPTEPATPFGPILPPSPGTSPSPRPTASQPPLATGGGDPSRIRIASLKIDLPIVPEDHPVRGNKNNYPLCDVAQYLNRFASPGEEGSTYIYAHAQIGMFWPLLRASRRTDGGASMVGALVEVYTNDDKLHMYEIYRVKRHAIDFTLAEKVPAGEHRLVLQTSEGWWGHREKLQLAAKPLSVASVSQKEANPTPHPRVCLPPS
jgi:hypothetical protein